MKVKYGKIILWIWAISIVLLSIFTLYLYSVSINWLNLYGELPNLKTLENPRSEVASELYSVDNVLLGKYFRENRTPAEFDELSKNLVNALIATEDIRFEEHSGVDLKALFRVFTGIVTKSDKGGGSTITQQLAKNLFGTRGELNTGKLSSTPGFRTLIIKTKEWLLSVKLEKSYTKREILAMYLNTVNFGSNASGIKVASKTFFNTSCDKLTIEQSALLVGLLKAPTYYSPVQNPENATFRRNTVLYQLKRYGFIDNSVYDSLRIEPIVLDYSVENHNQGSATYFRSVIRDYLLNWCRERNYDLFSDGLKIYCTIDSKLQAYAEEAVDAHMREQQKLFDEHWAGLNPWVDESNKEIKGYINMAIQRSDEYKTLKAIYNNDSVAIWTELKKPVKTTLFTWDREIDTIISTYDAFKHNKRFLHAGFMAMDPHTGHIKAWVGGINHKYFKYDHVMQSRRQPGSTFKPIVYTAAIANGYSPCFTIVDAPVTFEVFYNKERQVWIPQNSDGVFSGEELTLRQALARSINSVTAALMKKLTPEVVVDYGKRLGIKSPLDPVPALCLGSSDVSLYELIGAYSTFSNEGIWNQPFYITRIEDKNSNVIQEFIPTRQEVLDDETAYLMIHMLKGSNQERGGTSLGLYRWGILGADNEVAAKTGTTSNYSDGWFIGLTKDLAAGAWVGGDDRSIHFRTMNLGQGARTAMPIWGNFMRKVYADTSTGISKGPFKRPGKPLTIEIDCTKYDMAEISSDTIENNTNIYRMPDKKEIDL